jgi:hypothetical protein
VSLTPAGAAFVDRFREFNARQMRQLLEQVDDAGLAHVAPAIAALIAAADRLVTTTPASHSRKDPA